MLPLPLDVIGSLIGKTTHNARGNGTTIVSVD